MVLMKSIPVLSIKGGVGKSTVCARLGLRLRDIGFKIGFLDCDVTGSNLPSALGMEEPFPRGALDTRREKMKAVSIDGYEVFSIAFRFGKAALMWEGGEKKISAFGQEYDLHGTGRYQLVRQMLQNVEFGDIDYLLVDCPPTSGDEVLSLIEHLKNIWGVILVCQPTNLSVQDIERALNMVEVKRLPVLGMVANMTYAIAPVSREEFLPFLDAGVDLEHFAQQRGIPLLVSIPLTPEREIIDSKFRELADKVINAKAVKIWQKSFKEKFETGILKGSIKGFFAKEN